MTKWRVSFIVPRFAFTEANAVLVKDKAKCLLMAAQFALKFLNLWPEGHTIRNTICYFLMVTLIGLHEICMFACLSVKNDVNTIANILAFSNPGLQVR